MIFEGTLIAQKFGTRFVLAFFPVVTASLAVGQTEVVSVFLTEPVRPLKLSTTKELTSRFRIGLEDVESNELLPGIPTAPLDGIRINSAFQEKGTSINFTITRMN